MPASTASSTADRAPRWFVWLGLLALAGYGLFLQLNATVAAGGPDSSGYLNSARLLASGQRETRIRLPAGFATSNAIFRPHFQPAGFTAFAENDRLVPTYATGLPLHFVVAQEIFGAAGGVRVIETAAALLAIWLAYAVGRALGLDWPLAAAGAVILAACPVMLYTSIQPLSDTLATTWSLAAIWCGLRARARGSWAAACGAAYAVAVLVRPTNLVLLPALLVLLGPDWRRLGICALAGLPFAAWLATYNTALYGGPFRSGYAGLAHEFSGIYFVPTFWHFLRWLGVFVPVVLLALPFVAFVRRPGGGRPVLALALWFSAITGVYVFYKVSHEAWSCLRFILPAMPALILLGLLGLHALLRRDARGPRIAAALVLSAWAVAGSWLWSRPHGVFYMKGYEDPYIAIGDLARARLPGNALVVSSMTSGALYYYTDFPVLRWDFVNRDEFKTYAALAQRNGVPLAAAVFNVEEDDAFKTHCPGDWEKIGSASNIGLWRMKPPATAP